jgi:hypothetical protein
MGRAKNTLKSQDVSSTPIKVQYSVTHPSSSLENYGITTNRGINIPYSVDLSNPSLERLVNYRTIRQLYYQQHLIESASGWDPVWQSTAASGSFDNTIYNFPSETTASISILTIPSSQFGEQISKKSFLISSSAGSPQYSLIDDGNGNIVDQLSGSLHVGNIFYAQGVAVITNSNYVGILLNPHFSITVSICE